MNKVIIKFVANVGVNVCRGEGLHKCIIPIETTSFLPIAVLY